MNGLSPISRTLKKVDQLRQLANDCEERARLASNADARSRYHTIAADARLIARSRHLMESGMNLALAALQSQARFAAWLDGEVIAGTEKGDAVGYLLDSSRFQHHERTDLRASPPDERSVVPADALNARQLAERFTIPERSVRRAIERGVRNGVPGFYSNGRKWFADPDAFARERKASGRIVAEPSARCSKSP